MTSSAVLSVLAGGGAEDAADGAGGGADATGGGADATGESVIGAWRPVSDLARGGGADEMAGTDETGETDEDETDGVTALGATSNIGEKSKFSSEEPNMDAPPAPLLSDELPDPEEPPECGVGKGMTLPEVASAICSARAASSCWRAASISSSCQE
jgi:hypothetical protein